MKWYRKAAEQGHADAQFALGACYANGRGVGKDEVEAGKWYRKAAEQGHAEAQCRLVHKAAEQSHAQAQNNLQVLSSPSIQQELPRLGELMNRLNSLIGLSRVKEDVSRMIN